VLVISLVLRPPERTRQALALGLLLGGAAGNGLDRWRLGSVVDFLALVPVPFPVFNLADVAINLAVVAFVLDLLADRPPPGSHG
jgi:signal peptidase II